MTSVYGSLACHVTQVTEDAYAKNECWSRATGILERAMDGSGLMFIINVTEARNHAYLVYTGTVRAAVCVIFLRCYSVL